MLNAPIDGRTIFVATTKTLKKYFPEIAVYIDVVAAAPKYPQFFIAIADANIQKTTFTYYNLSYTVNIKYRISDDPASVTGIKEKLSTMAFKLLDKLETLIMEEETSNTPARITRVYDTRYSIVDDVLEYFFSVDFLLSREELTVLMQSLETHITLEGGQ